MKILVIDDEPQIRRALRVGLEQNNYEVLLAASGEEGLDLAAAKSPDLIILALACLNFISYSEMAFLAELVSPSDFTTFVNTYSHKPSPLPCEFPILHNSHL